MHAIVLIACLLAITIPSEGYALKYKYAGATFFDNFNFFTAGDPTHGTVNYVDRATAQREGLINVDAGKGTVYIGTDTKNVVTTGRGRDSVRLESNTTFQAGTLFIMDLNHMPTGCATWPAWWLVGPNWPNNGEIDIIEGVNQATVDQSTLHSNGGCSINESTSLFTGHWAGGTNCQGNTGCGIVAGGGSYGAPFNSAGGGVFACEWTNQRIQMFYFGRNNIPADVNSNTPNPAGWGKPFAYFTLGAACPATHFQKQTMVINLTFCGDWAGAVFPASCAADRNCGNYVKKTPGAFQQAYWEIRSITVFE